MKIAPRLARASQRLDPASNSVFIGSWKCPSLVMLSLTLAGGPVFQFYTMHHPRDTLMAYF